MYKVIWSGSTEDDLYTIPYFEKLLKRINSYLSQSPRELGKALTSEYKGLYRYRYGDYRIIYKIDNDSKQVVILKIGYRKEVYSQ